MLYVRLFLITAFIPLIFSCGIKNSEAQYVNPLPVSFGDPFILKASNGKYYMYGTQGAEKGYCAYESTDLISWKELGFVYQKDENSWGGG